MGRPKGSFSKPGSMKPGPKPTEKDPTFHALKNKVIGLIETEQADNLSEAAKVLGVKSTKLYLLAEKDKTFEEQVRIAQNIIADRLEAKLDNSNSPGAHEFRLKKLRPEYRDNAKIDLNTDKLEKLLRELIDVKKVPEKPVEVKEEPKANILEEQLKEIVKNENP
jgi:hypothetical protein